MRGSIVKRGKSYSIVVEIGKDPDTQKRKQQWIAAGRTRREAEAKLTDVMHGLSVGTFLKPSKVTVGEFLRQWLTDYAAVNVRPKTFEGYRERLEKHVIPALGSILLAQLKPAHIQEYIAKKLKEGLSANTVTGQYRILSEALTHAVRWDMVNRNVCQAVDAPRIEHKEMQALDIPGVQRLLRAAEGTRWHTFIYTAVGTGMRRSELLALRWRDLDLQSFSLTVRRVLHWVKDKGFIFTEPKTKKSARTIPLPASVAMALRAHRERQEAEREDLGVEITGDSLVFARVDGSPFYPSAASHSFQSIARKAGLDEGIHLHSLRHTHASLLLAQGENLVVISQRLGHAKPSITSDIYAHLMPGIQEQAAVRFDQQLLQTARALTPKG
jgi:integrase